MAYHCNPIETPNRRQILAGRFWPADFWLADFSLADFSLEFFCRSVYNLPIQSERRRPARLSAGLTPRRKLSRCPTLHSHPPAKRILIPQDSYFWEKTLTRGNQPRRFKLSMNYRRNRPQRYVFSPKPTAALQIIAELSPKLHS